jgi:hypothetical protein
MRPLSSLYRTNVFIEAGIDSHWNNIEIETTYLLKGYENFALFCKSFVIS